MKDLTLVVMAAGMGSRFGGPKQVMPVDEDGNFIIDYSVYDAIRAGFKRVVFVIKKDFRETFESTIGKRLEGKIDVEYAYQKLDDIPSTIDISERAKPWGTVQAVLCAKDHVDRGFAVINADDFYGTNAFIKAAEFLNNENRSYHYAVLGYPFSNTIWGSEVVKRGVLKTDGDNVIDIVESSIEPLGETAKCTPLDKGSEFFVPSDQLVSMNMFAFQNDMFDLLEKYFKEFFEQDYETIMKSEALLPVCIKDNIKNGTVNLVNIPSDSLWMGMTYKEDLDKVKENIVKMKDDGEYPKSLWK